MPEIGPRPRYVCVEQAHTIWLHWMEYPPPSPRPNTHIRVLPKSNTTVTRSEGGQRASRPGGQQAPTQSRSSDLTPQPSPGVASPTSSGKGCAAEPERLLMYSSRMTGESALSGDDMVDATAPCADNWVVFNCPPEL